MKIRCRFKGQFVKVLRTMHDEYLADLAQSQESELQVRVLAPFWILQSSLRACLSLFTTAPLPPKETPLPLYILLLLLQAVRTLLAHYLQNAQFRTQPEGRAMPRVDMSMYARA